MVPVPAERHRSGASLDPRHLVQFFAMAKDLFAIFDLSGRFIAVNGAWEAVLGWDADELTSKTFLEFVHPDDAEATMAGVRPSGPGPATGLLNRYRTRTGDWRWLEWTWSLSPDEPVVYASARDITDRVDADAALRASDERYRLLLDHLPNTIVVNTDTDLVCRFLGGGVIARLGVNPDDYVGRSLFDIYEPYGEHRGALLRHHEDAAAGITSNLLLHSAITGEDYETTIVPLPAADGTIAGSMLVATTVTERLAREREVGRLVRVLAASGEAIVSTDLQGRIASVNPRAAELFGYVDDELIGRLLRDLVIEEQRDSVAAVRDDVLCGRCWRGELDFVRRDGRRWSAAVTLSPVVGDDGALSAVSAVIADISDRKEAERQLAAVTRRFRQTIEHAPIGMGITAINGAWLQVNPALRQLLGYTEQELLTRSFRDTTHPDDQPGEDLLLQEVLAGRRHGFESEKRCVRSDGAVIWVVLTVSLVRDEHGRPLHLIRQLLDISGRKLTEARLRVEADLDPLTKTLNRRRFAEILTGALADSSAQRYALMFVDLDGFKAVNDQHGHAAGDAVLQAVGQVLNENIRASDAVGRHGGDEFVALVRVASEEIAQLIAGKLQQKIDALRVPVGDTTTHAGASIGVVLLNPSRDRSAEEALARADRAMYRAKIARRAARR
jgi:diguanylate cyclase (GGDEF)-like protein/PAS domain S-box-containing protein